MTGSNAGLELFESVGPDQIGAVNRVLSCLSKGPLERQPLLQAIRRRSGISGAIVDASDCLDFAKSLGLVAETSALIELSEFGNVLLRSANWPPYNKLNDEQGFALFGELILRPSFREPLATTVQKMRRRPDGSAEIFPQHTQLTQAELDCLQALQSMRVARFHDGAIIVSSVAFRDLIELLGTSTATTEDELAEALERQRIRGKNAELHVAKLEAQRLVQGNRSDLSELVERVSVRNVNAGYDIWSFELDGSNRYIEVKSSTDSRLAFILTANELRFLSEHPDNSWIYFVPRAHQLPSDSHPVVAISNPASWVANRSKMRAREYSIELIPGVRVPQFAAGPIIQIEDLYSEPG